MSFTFKSLVFFLVCLGPAVQALAQDVCFKHDDIPVYCDEPFRNRMELGFDEMAKYGAKQNWIPGPVHYLACIPGDAFGGPNCAVNQPWFNGPALPIEVDSDVTIKVHYNIVFSCTALPNSLCSKGWTPAELARFELFVDGLPVAEPYILRGSDLVLESSANGSMSYVLNKPKSDIPSGGFKQFLLHLSAPVAAGSKISLHVSPSTTVVAVQLAHITITSISK